jgi:hypothetical protein
MVDKIAYLWMVEVMVNLNYFNLIQLISSFIFLTKFLISELSSLIVKKSPLGKEIDLESVTSAPLPSGLKYGLKFSIYHQNIMLLEIGQKI